MFFYFFQNGAEKVGVYDAALKACALEGNPAQAETLIRVMLETGCSPGSTAMRYANPNHAGVLWYLFCSYVAPLQTVI